MVYLCCMQLNSVIFDMDGLLIDSEPYWAEAGAETLAQYDIKLTDEQYHTSVGLRTREWVEWWFAGFDIDSRFTPDAERTVIARAIEKIRDKAEPMQGVPYILEFFKKKQFNIGLASSSPLALIDVVIEKLGIAGYVQAVTSAEHLPQGKPHPSVYLQCAEKMNVLPMQCVCFEDSFNGLIAAKAARMKCVAIPDKMFKDQLRWNAADLVLPHLEAFGDQELQLLNK
ncbi:MAG: hexitol phosphatase HxpB [Chitinophagaceae bacterium]|nr:MAG: hexitol phosphatase HxpB [Chitinophagaceae bacterium]